MSFPRRRAPDGARLFYLGEPPGVRGPAPLKGVARNALVKSPREVLNYPGSEKRSVAFNDC